MVSRKLLILLLCALGASISAQSIKVVVNGSELAFEGTQPQVFHGRVLVPLRSVFEELGANVRYSPYVKAVVAEKGTTYIEMAIGDRTVRVNASTVRIDSAVRVIEGRTLVPLRFVSETLGAKVRWDSSTRTVTIDLESAQAH